ncbi:sulfur oxidation c-type cytochrome SoxX [Cognatazoarcus halotolerans]|uniref:sulfur oxidation c-type cytochrome SoxX n=1 Tax=Cognatazoarcus halotolerans TaxID=2686016 RepID=UPI001359ACBC|nr:sulfur oxidation c-type cytochrome SoxX [Cognatazoarcus halotolerans]MCB1898417.1 sulfur oxidation c-type cytochrome SoxX [Rhodocyclaceae bacterium]MCP5309362.1 sulfur oxidation c-type cytochrome SoxX [Zoogloeaceae bacterium]
MKKFLMIAPLALGMQFAVAGDDMHAEFKQMMDSSFKGNGIAEKHRLYQLDFQAACSTEKSPSPAMLKAIEAEQMKTIRWPSDGKYTGDWKSGEKIAISGRGLTWNDKADAANGGGCYNCHQMSHNEISYGTIGPSLLNYGKLRGNSSDMLKYTWGKIWNAKAYNACSNMPRNGDAEILTERQIKDVMAYLFDPESPVNKP